MKNDAQAIDLNAPRLCPYCLTRQCMRGFLNCGPCMQNVWRQHDATKISVRLVPVTRPSWWARLKAWFLV